MIKNYFITGDKHGNFNSILQNELVKNSDNAVIILGDHGFNYYLNKYDDRLKEEISQNSSCIWYCVRGNHCARPQNVQGMQLVYDSEINGEVYMEERFPNIRYLRDGGIYLINGYKTLVIGGAYSVDKWYRLQRGWRWFEDELLTTEEMNKIFNEVEGQSFDLVLTHTCPLDWEPTDLFIGGIDQTKVDTSMEVWMNTLKDKISWKVWLFGHFHTDRAQQKGVEICYLRIEPLEDIMKRNSFDFS